MDVLIAIVRVRAGALKRRQNFLVPNDYELLLTIGINGSPASRGLPICRARRGEDANEAALNYAANIDSDFARRAICVPLNDKTLEDFKFGEPSTSTHRSKIHPTSSHHHVPNYPLVCVPIVGNNNKIENIKFLSKNKKSNTILEFHELGRLINEALNGDPSIDAHSRHLIIRIEEWLTEQQRRNVSFVSRLFFMRDAASRIRACSHNPANNPRLLYYCHKSIDRKECAKRSQYSSELEEAVKLSNTIRARMIEMEKYDRYQINPIFGVGASYWRRETAPAYFAKGRRTVLRCSLQASPSEQRSPTEFWEQQFPLHKYAFDGDDEKVKDFLRKGYDPNELDNDFWTPLHYCAFYNRFRVCEELMTHAATNVNAVNKNGATALHFAALNGNAYLVELILSHQFVDVNIKDVYGKTALDLCEPVPKSDWQDVAFLLRQRQLRPTKIEVQLAGGTALQVEVRDAHDATAGELRESVLLKEGLGTAAELIFAVWIVSKRLSLQLKAEQKVSVHLEKWPEHLEKWGSPPDAEEQPTITRDGDIGLVELGAGSNRHFEDRPRIVLKRDARTLLGDEQLLARKSPAVLSLLYAEAEENFLAGLYPCGDKFYVPMAAIIARRLFGDSPHFNFALLSHVLPRHLVSTDLKAANALAAKITNAQKSLKARNLIQLQLVFLKYCWSLNVYGCTFFKACMLMSKPLRGSLSVAVGLNDWGMSIVNMITFKQVAALELKNLDVKYRPNTNFVEVSSRKRDFSATVTTPQAMLINNLLKQLKTKVDAANGT